MNLDQLKKSYLSKKIPKAQYIEDMFSIHKYLYDYADLISGTDIKKIEIEEGVIMTTRDDIKILCSRNDRRIAPIEILNFGSYEIVDSNMILNLIENGQTVFDIGANFGWYSLLLSKKFPRANIYAFEPVGDTFNYLEKNIDINGFENIKALNLGFSDKKGEIVLFLPESESGIASMANLKGDKSVKKVKCRITTLDSYFKRTGDCVDFIKCDVEGAELFVFRGGQKTIEKCKPAVFAEMLRKWCAKFNYHPNEIIELFKSFGYGCFYAKGGKLIAISKITEDTMATNFFFLHLQKHKAKIKSLS